MPSAPITGLRLKDGTSITVNPHNPRDTHTLSQTLLWVTVRCGATGAVRRIKWRDVARIRRTSEAGDYWTP
ncbi:hypothetical protein [Streptomyces anulatus]|uniref:hypothetical protein n=1 Tax=Streptomyces anulatus TaxID=1892 RepID=UPI00344010B6|nr:hypothetical protein OH791_33695 [Streptomyces anulatus]